MKIFAILDHRAANKTFLPLIEPLRKLGHEIEVDMYYDPEKVKWCDIIWGDYIQGGVCDMMRDIDKIDKPIYLRGIDIDLYYGHYCGVDFNRVKGVYFIANFMKEMAEKEWIGKNGELKVPTGVTKLGIDLKLWHYKDRSILRGKNVGWINRFWSGKGIALMLQIAHKLIKQDPEFHFEIAGVIAEPWLKIYFDQYIRRNGLDDNIKHVGAVESVNDWMNDKDYMLCTSMKEALSLPMIEGMAKGIKPVIHNWFGADDVYPSKYVFNTIDEAIEMLTNKEYDSEEYRNFVLKEHNLDNSVKQFLEIIS